MMKADYPSPYRRSYHRFILDASASLIIDKNREEPSILRDLCPRGSGVVTHHWLKENEQVTIMIKIPYLFTSPVYKQAKVVWSKKIEEDLWEGGLDFGEDNKIILSKSSSHSP
jgi:hypothetical protein